MKNFVGFLKTLFLILFASISWHGARALGDVAFEVIMHEVKTAENKEKSNEKEIEMGFSKDSSVCKMRG